MWLCSRVLRGSPGYSGCPSSSAVHQAPQATLSGDGIHEGQNRPIAPCAHDPPRPAPAVTATKTARWSELSMPPIGFSKTALDLSEEKWDNVERFNACLERLRNRRKTEIAVDGPLVESKTAWKCAVLQQALLYRVTMLASGCAEAWNSRNVVCSILAARSLLETVACVSSSATR